LTTPANERNVILVMDASVAGFSDPSHLGARTAPNPLKRFYGRARWGAERPAGS